MIVLSKKIEVNTMENERQDSYVPIIENAIDEIKKGERTKARDLIASAMKINPDEPMTHNLLGAIAEEERDFGLALKHYRAANALDPTFQPAISNIERLTTYHINGINHHMPNFGEKNEVEKQEKGLKGRHIWNKKKTDNE